MPVKEALLALTFLNPNIPPAHLEGLSVEYSERQQGVDEGFDAGYCRDTRTVYLYQQHMREIMEQILSHEIGHHVCYENNHPAVFGNGNKEGHDFVSERAKLNPREDCAETYRAYYQTNICKPWVGKTRLMMQKCFAISRFHRKFNKH